MLVPQGAGWLLGMEFALLGRVVGEAGERRADRRGEAVGTTTAASWRRSLRGATCWLSMLAGAVSLLGCPGYFYSSRAYFTNSTHESVKVRVQKLVAEVD